KGEGEREGDEDEKNHKDEDGKMKREEIRHEEDEKQRGEQGTEGAQGPEGPVGPIGPQGPKGEDGTMTFEDLTPEQVENLRGEQGPEGPQGPQGPQGEQGADGGLLNTNLNLIPYNESFWEVGAITVSNGQNSVNDTAIRTKEAIKITQGETYTFHDKSTYLSAINRFNLVLYRDGTFIKFLATINRGDSRTFVAEGGNELRITAMA